MHHGDGPAATAAGSGVPARRWLDLVATPLAADEAGGLFWRRHLRLVVGCAWVTALLGAVWSVATSAPNLAAVLVVEVLVMVVLSLTTLLPMERWAQDRRGVLVIYGFGLLGVVTVGGFGWWGDIPAHVSPWVLVLLLVWVGVAAPPAATALFGVMSVVLALVITVLGPNAVPEGPVTVGGLAVVSVLVVLWSQAHERDAGQQREMATRLAVLADTDTLTACLNRRAFQRALAVTAGRSVDDVPLSLVVLDLDGFKRVNDRHGHPAGDALLVHVADALRASSREGDLVSRLGGDEFAVLLPATDHDAAAAAAERLRQAVEVAGRDHGVTASVGVTTCPGGGDVAGLLSAADARMYGAERAGGNQQLLGA